jgi:hypothetical protein
MRVEAQDAGGRPTKVEGAADFRTAPRLESGQYRAAIVTGESIWFALQYTNSFPLIIEGSLDAAPSTTNDDGSTTASRPRAAEPVDDLEFGIELVAPNLESATTDPKRIEFRGTYDQGSVNRWFIRVKLDTNGQLGVERSFVLKVDGANDARFGACDELDDCDAPKRLRQADARLAKAQAGREIEPAAPGSETPIALVVAFLVIALGLGLAAFVVWRRRREPSPEANSS